MPVIEDEALVVHVVIRRSAESEFAEERVPRVLDLGVYECQPARIDGAEGHVRPHIAMHELCRDGERYEDHANSVGDRSVESVEHFGVEEAVVWLMG